MISDVCFELRIREECCAFVENFHTANYGQSLLSKFVSRQCHHLKLSLLCEYVVFTSASSIVSFTDNHWILLLLLGILGNNDFNLKMYLKRNLNHCLSSPLKIRNAIHAPKTSAIIKLCLTFLNNTSVLGYYSNQVPSLTQ